MGDIITDLVINNEDKRLVEGFASVEVVDRQNDVISAETLSKAMLNYMSRGGIILYGHENKPIGKVVQWDVREVNGVRGVHIVAEIYKDSTLADKVWQDIKNKVLKGFSIGGVAVSTEERTDGSNKVRILKEIELNEISIVVEPANQMALIENVSVAKGDVEKDGRPPKEWWDRCISAVSGKTSTPEQLCGYVFYNVLGGDRERAMKKMDDEFFLKEFENWIQKPFGKWSSFADCESDMRSRGYSEDSAKRICGYLQNKLEKVVSEEVINTLIENIDKERFINKDELKNVEVKAMAEEEKKPEEEEEEEEKPKEKAEVSQPLEQKIDALIQSQSELNDLLRRLVSMLQSTEEETEKANYRIGQVKTPQEEPNKLTEGGKKDEPESPARAIANKSVAVAKSVETPKSGAEINEIGTPDNDVRIVIEEVLKGKHKFAEGYKLNKRLRGEQ
jgi:HK97 family phage prohead protease